MEDKAGMLGKVMRARPLPWHASPDARKAGIHAQMGQVVVQEAGVGEMRSRSVVGKGRRLLGRFG